VTFYVEQHNSVMPHASFNGQPPNEVFFLKGETVAAQLLKGRAEARQKRLAANRLPTFATC